MNDTKSNTNYWFLWKIVTKYLGWNLLLLLCLHRQKSFWNWTETSFFFVRCDVSEIEFSIERIYIFSMQNRFHLNIRSGKVQLNSNFFCRCCCCCCQCDDIENAFINILCKEIQNELVEWITFCMAIVIESTGSVKWLRLNKICPLDISAKRNET